MQHLRLLIVFGIFLVYSCSSISIETDYDPDIDFSQYKTYRWYAGEMPEGDKLSANPLVKKRVMAGIDKALEAKGYKMATGDDADFAVIVHAGSKERMQVNNYGYGGYGYGRYRGGYGWGGAYGTTDITYYEETTLVIDIADAGEKVLAWRGSGTGTVKSYSNQEEMQERIDDVVARILADFPPGAGK